MERGSAVGTYSVIGADLVFAIRADEYQLGAAGCADSVVLAHCRPAVWAQRLSAGQTFWRADGHLSATAGADSSWLRAAARAGALFGEQHQVALRTQAHPTLGARACRWDEMCPADGTDCPMHEQRPDPPGYASGGLALLVFQGLKTVGATIGSAVKPLAAARTAAGKQEPTVGTDLCS